ncbi:citrate lyase alpha chain-like [Stegodyphus dumicola]|uniref:citrate lyase alpha chain-like n=1 Tax=Stegodyphus dumicola TaxID=202533 RepID=UPI0015ABDDC6|nr:citrate lyase alpha chain-like [Stegodyphus dumicola]
MIEKGYKAGFCLGGITSHQVKLLEENLTNLLIDVQSFDLGAAESLLKNEKHIEIDADMYANPFNKSPYCNKLDFVILSALEVDVNFNVNVITGSDGVIRGASGGHSDTAMGAKVSIVALPLFRGRIPCITNKVITNITPGESVDVIVTDFGIAVNPNRQDLIKTLKAKKIPLVNIQHLADQAQNLLDQNNPIEIKNKLLAIEEQFPFNRIIDFDVYNLEYKPIKRVNRRLCLICDNN